MSIKTGTLLQERYQINEQLGGHGVAFTYSAHDNRLKKPVIVKELSLAHLDNWKSYELFEREVNILKQLKHDGIPLLIDSFKVEREQDLLLYLVMDRAPGQSLENKLKEGWHPSQAEVIDLAKQALNILVYLHSFRPPVIHRDIKPSNLVLNEEGQLYFIDFGAVQEVIEPAGGSTIVGTFGYMPLEQFSGQTYPASDLYALGATLIHLLTGIHPSELILDGMELQFNSLVFCSPDLTFWLEKMVNPDYSKRFSSAHSALEELSGIEVSISHNQALLNKNKKQKPPDSKQDLIQDGELLLYKPHQGGIPYMLSNVWMIALTYIQLFYVFPGFFNGGLFFIGASITILYGMLMFYALRERHIHSIQMNFSNTNLKGVLTKKSKFIETSNICNVVMSKGFMGSWGLLVQTPQDEYRVAFGLSQPEAEWLKQELLNYVLKVSQNA